MPFRRVLCFLFLTFSLSSVPATAEPILTIGEFQWDDDGSGLGPVLRILNYSDTPAFATGPVPDDYFGGAFTNLLITIDGTETLLGDLLSGDSLTVFGNFGTLEALLGFSFRAQQYSLLLTQDAQICGTDPQACITVPSEFGEQHATRLIDYDVPAQPVGVPEPSTLILMTVGFAGAVLRRGRTRRL